MTRLAVTLILAALVGSLSAAAEEMTMVSWGGAYGRATQKALLDPFGADTGYAMRMEDFNGGLAEIRAQVETGNVHWDVVDLEAADAVRGCDEGLLEVLAPEDLFPGQDADAAVQDFLPGMISECGVGLIVYSTIYAYRTDHFTGRKPSTMADFFDLETFPGRRGMRRSPYGTMEFALVADGVPADQVYETLSTPEGVDRAFRKLDSIKEHVVWWEAGAQPPQMLADGEVVMSIAYNGRIFNAQVLENQPFVIVWDGQALDTGYLAIVAGTERYEEAMQFVKFANRPGSIANVSKYISYGPVRLSARALVDRHLETGTAMQPHMPTSPDNMKRALSLDWRWWSENRDDMYERFSAWLAR
jgi:putative spermidine/putrescine transport system substrate-binding protein